MIRIELSSEEVDVVLAALARRRDAAGTHEETVIVNLIDYIETEANQ